MTTELARQLTPGNGVEATRVDPNQTMVTRRADLPVVELLGFEFVDAPPAKSRAPNGTTTAPDDAPLDDARPVANLFTAVPARFFAPLTGQGAPLYAEALQKFYAYEYESVPDALLKDIAVALCEDILFRNPLWRENRLALIRTLGDDALELEWEAEEGAARRRAARYMVGRMEACGWFHFEYRSDRGGEVLSFYPYASRILTTLVKVARGDEPVLEGYTHDIATMLDPKTFARSPGASLERVRQSTLEFVRELKTLEKNIYAATRVHLERAATAADVLQETFEHYQRLGGDNYHRLKTSENYYRVQRDVLVRLDVIERDLGLALDEAGRWYATQHRTEAGTGRRYVEQTLALIRSHLESLPALIADIDRRHARFRGMARRKLSYLLRQERDSGAKLSALIDAVAASEAPELPVSLFHGAFLGPDDTSLFTPRTFSAAPPAQPLVEQTPMSQDAIAAQKGRIMALGAFTSREVDRFVSRLMGESPRMDFTSLPFTSDYDYVRAIHVAHRGLIAGAPFRFTPRPCDRLGCRDPLCDGCHVAIGRYRVPRGVLERVQRPRGMPGRLTRL
jgi:hypothetical protein